MADRTQYLKDLAAGNAEADRNQYRPGPQRDAFLQHYAGWDPDLISPWVGSNVDPHAGPGGAAPWPAGGRPATPDHVAGPVSDGGPGQAAWTPAGAETKNVAPAGPTSTLSASPMSPAVSGLATAVQGNYGAQVPPASRGVGTTSASGTWTPTPLMPSGARAAPASPMMSPQGMPARRRVGQGPITGLRSALGLNKSNGSGTVY